LNKNKQLKAELHISMPLPSHYLCECFALHSFHTSFVQPFLALLGDYAPPETGEKNSINLLQLVSLLLHFAEIILCCTSQSGA